MHDRSHAPWSRTCPCCPAPEIKGEGDRVATEIWNKATSVDPEFYAFYRTLEAYRNSFDEETSIVLAPEGEFFSYFGKSLK